MSSSAGLHSQQKYNTNFFHQMETEQPQTDEKHYVTVLQYMQKHDCSYQHAVQCLKPTFNNLPHEHEKHTSKIYQRDTASESKFQLQFQESLVENGEIVALTPKQMKLLENYFKGNQQIEESKVNSYKFCQFMSTQFTKIKRKMRCLKYLNPKRCWRQIKSRKDKDKYKKVHTIEKKSITQSVKSEYIESNCWIDIKDDIFDEILEKRVQNMVQFLTIHQELLVQVKSLSERGLLINLPLNFKIDGSIRSILLVKQERRENIEPDLRVKNEQYFEIVVLSENKFKQVLKIDTLEIDYAYIFIDLYGQIQILSKLKTLTQKDKENSLSKFKRYLIKSGFLLALKQGKTNIFQFTMANHHEQFSSDEDNTRQDEIDNHRSIIQEQDFLYQSMLNQHKFKQEKETIRKNSLNDMKTHRQKMKLSIKQQPTSSEKTICIYFRTPVGSSIKRNFYKNDHVQQIYDWIECEDSIQFQDEQNRSFDLYEGYPPQILSHMRSDHLSNLLTSEQQCVRLIIRQK